MVMALIAIHLVQTCKMSFRVDSCSASAQTDEEEETSEAPASGHSQTSDAGLQDSEELDDENSRRARRKVRRKRQADKSGHLLTISHSETFERTLEERLEGIEDFVTQLKSTLGDLKTHVSLPKCTPFWFLYLA